MEENIKNDLATLEAAILNRKNTIAESLKLIEELQSANAADMKVIEIRKEQLAKMKKNKGNFASDKV